jgi:hypothetical protein
MHKIVKHSLLPLALVSGFIGSPALAYRYVAADAPPPAYPGTFYNNYYPRDSVYIAGDAGLGALDTPEQFLLPPDNSGISSASYEVGKSVAAGGSVGIEHVVGRHFSIGSEFGYDYNGNSKYTEDYNQNFTYTDSSTFRISSQDLHVLAVGNLLIGRGMKVFVKGGAARVDQTLRITNQVDYSNLPFLMGETRIIGYKPMAAIGLGYQFRAVEIYGQYSHIFGASPENFYPDLFNQDGTFANVVSTDTFKIGLAVHVPI